MGPSTRANCPVCRSNAQVVEDRSAAKIIKPPPVKANATAKPLGQVALVSPSAVKTSTTPESTQLAVNTPQTQVVKPVAYYCLDCNAPFEFVKSSWSGARCPSCKGAKIVLAVHAPPPVDMWKGIPVDVLALALREFDEGTLTVLARVCRKFQAAANLLFPRSVPFTLGYGSTTHNLREIVLNESSRAANIAVAVDKFKDLSLLKTILATGARMDLVLGTESPFIQQAIQSAAQSRVTLATAFHKMHEKFWVFDKAGLLIGSPNVSFSGLQKQNLESCILIRSPYLAKVFIQFLQILKLPDLQANDPRYVPIEQALTKYNKQQHGVRAALAPAINIANFMVEELQGATKIVMRQFLVGKKDRDDTGPGLDVIDALCAMASQGCEIDIYIDEGAYLNADGATWFVKPAVKILSKAGIKVWTQKPVVVVNDDSDKENLLHDKLILARMHSGVLRTLVGTAGLTKHVIANENAEGFISTDLRHVFDTMRAHHENTLNQKVARTRQVG